MPVDYADEVRQVLLAEGECATAEAGLRHGFERGAPRFFEQVQIDVAVGVDKAPKLCRGVLFELDFKRLDF